MSWKRSARISALLAATAVLAGCGSATRPAGPPPGGAAPAGPAGALTVGVTDGRLGDAVTDTSGGRLQRLSKGGTVDPAAKRRAPNVREGVAGGDACANADLLPDGSNLATIAEATLCLLNGERADRGLTALRLNDRLQRAALAHGGDMVEHLYFSHDGRDGSHPAERIRAAGYLSSGGGWRIGENLAWGTGDLATPKAIMAAWMASAGHRENILEPRYREVGIGVVAGNPTGRDGGGATFVTEFGAVERALRVASKKARSGTAAGRAGGKARTRRASVRRARARARARSRARSRVRRARRARVALAPRSRRGRVVGRVASVRGGLG